MKKIKKYKFDELYKMESGISTKAEQSGKGYPFVSFKCVYDDYFLPDELKDLMDTSDAEKEKYSIKKGDILLTRTSETIDELGISSVALKDYKNATYSGFLKRLRPKKNESVYHKYIAFYLRSNFFRKMMTNNSVLTLRASLNEKIFSYLELFLPDYDDQVKYGDLLFAIQSKIKINKKIINEIYNLNKTIYDYWFLQFDFDKNYKSSGGKMVFNEDFDREIPEDFTYVELGEICDLYQPEIISQEQLKQDGKYLVYGSNGIIGRYDRYNHKETELIISCRGDCGNLHITQPCSWITGNSMVIKPKINELSITFLHRAISLSNISSAITGSVQGQITRKNLSKIKICIPEKDLSPIKKFKSLTNINLKKIIETNSENIYLTKLRDWLVPLMISNQIKL